MVTMMKSLISNGHVAIKNWARQRCPK